MTSGAIQNGVPTTDFSCRSIPPLLPLFICFSFCPKLWRSTKFQKLCGNVTGYKHNGIYKSFAAEISVGIVKRNSPVKLAKVLTRRA